MARSRTASVTAIRASGPRMMTRHCQKQPDHPTISHTLAGEPQEVLGEEQDVRADERDPEVDLSNPFRDHVAGHLWEPVVGTPKDCEDRAKRQHVMEVRYDVI